MPKRNDRREPESEYLTVEEVAELLSVDTSTVRRYIRDGLIEATQLPERGMYRIKKETIDRMLKRRARD